MKILSLIAAIMLTTLNVHATSNSEVCSNSDGSVQVKDGNVTIVDGIGDVGPVTSTKTIAEISENTENCVDGVPEYVWTKVTVQEVTYDIEENVSGKDVVLCTQVQTGISSTTCK